jgi:hypothetical protein
VVGAGVLGFWSRGFAPDAGQRVTVVDIEPSRPRSREARRGFAAPDAAPATAIW